MKVLSIDYGAKKVGLAISDELAMVSAKLPVLRADSDEEKIEGLIPKCYTFWHAIELGRKRYATVERSKKLHKFV
jgi:RNase H-fold protein (predicted Holliday junction resolvase)